jgi:uncharacterized protein YciW
VQAGVTPESVAAKAVATREKVLRDTQAAEDAVLRPMDAGAWSHAVRAAFAARIARLNGEEGLAITWLGEFADDAAAGIANPACKEHSQVMPAVLEFMDKVAADPRDIGGDDIKALLLAGVLDADIVRLCELNAFLAYQIRLIQGLRLIAGASS